MIPIERQSRGRKQLDHENRIQTLERRVPNDYPHVYSILLGDTGSVGPGSYNLGWAFGDPCSDEGGCDEGFYTDDTYLFLPTGFNGQFEVTMNIAEGSGSADNYLEPVTPGDITPTQLVLVGFVPYFSENGVVDTGSFVISSVFKMHAQEPPPYRSGGYGRVWSQYRVVAPNSALGATQRWALRPFVTILSPITTIGITGLVMAVKLMPPDSSFGAGQWSG